MKKLRTAILCILCAGILTGTVAAVDAAPTDTFTHWGSAGGTKSVATRPVYAVEKMVSLRSLGIQEDVGVIQDIECDDEGNTYILTSESRILSFNSACQLTGNFTPKDETGAPMAFDDAEGIYVLSASEIYIADTKNARVFRCVDGVVRQEIGLPDSELIPEDFTFQPSKVAKDSKGYLYVVSKGSYYGVLLYDPSGEFVGFYGANTVKGTVLTTLSYFWDMLTQNDEKRARSHKTLTYDFSDICVDGSDFVYTATGMNSDGNVGQLRMLSPGGTNILEGSDTANYGEPDVVKRLNNVIRQNFSGIQADGRGFIYALDATYGLIYIYDTDSNLIAAFGGGRGLGNQEGTFSAANSIALSGSRLMVADSLTNAVTVFELTAYGSLLLQAQQLTLDADYAAAEPLWQQVREYDYLNRLALRGLAKAAYSAENYEAAMDYAKAGNDSETYSLALEKTQSAFITQYFPLLFLGALVLVGGITSLILISVKRKLVLIPNAKVRTMVSGMYHPFRSFNDIKYKKMGSLPIAIVMTVLFYLTSVLAVTESDFRYTTFDAATYNSLFQIVQTVGLILLWSVANWGVSTLQQGNGRLKEVFVVTAYSTLPLILYNLISTPLTHLMASANGTMISGLHTLALILTGIMLCVGLMTIHDFSFPRFLFTAFIAVLLMILIVFVLFMVGILLSQFYSFISGIVIEAMHW